MKARERTGIHKFYQNGSVVRSVFVCKKDKMVDIKCFTSLHNAKKYPDFNKNACNLYPTKPR
jgi:hypothetical protein